MRISGQICGNLTCFHHPCARICLLIAYSGTEFLRRLVKEKPLSIVAGVVILLLILVAIFADVLALEKL